MFPIFDLQSKTKKTYNDFPKIAPIALANKTLMPLFNVLCAEVHNSTVSDISGMRTSVHGFNRQRMQQLFLCVFQRSETSELVARRSSRLILSFFIVALQSISL